MLVDYDNLIYADIIFLWPELKAEMEENQETTSNVTDVSVQEDDSILNESHIKDEPSLTEAIIGMEEVKTCYHNQARKNRMYRI